MSVKVADRGESKTEYIEAARRLAVEVGRIMANGPKKYGASHGDHIVKSALKIYEHCQIAQSIWVAKGGNAEADYEQRRWHLKEAKGLVNHVSAAVKVYFDIAKGCDKYDAKKATSQMHRVGDMCSRLSALLSGTIEWDASHMREIRRKMGRAD